MPWAVSPSPGWLNYAVRRDPAFIGGFRHAPNADAASWLVRSVLTSVWARRADLRRFVAGAD